jgi:hypothetical protein
MHRIIVSLMVSCLFFPSMASYAVPLESGFADPPLESRTRCFWWWLNGNVTKEAITRDLEEMKDKGMGGALIFDAGSSSYKTVTKPPAGPMFGTPAWRELFKHAVSQADRLGLELGLNIQSGWNLGGPNVSDLEAAKQLTWSETQVTGPATRKDLPAQPKSRNDFYQDIALLAYRTKPGAGEKKREPISDLERKSAFREIGGSAPDCRPLLFDVDPAAGEEDCATADIVNLNEYMDNGRLNWTVPEGEWILLRFGYTLTGSHASTASGDWQGLVVDYMSTSVLEAYWERNVEQLLKDIGPLAGTALKYLHTDSWECGGMNWTPDFETEFEQRRGYDPIPYLPVIAGKIIENRDASNRFLADFRKTIGDCVAENHYEVFANRAHERGLMVHPESGGPHAGPFDGLKCLGRSDIPKGEFWSPSPHRPRPQNRFFVKQAASAAHTYGKRFVAAEGFTTIGPHWEDVLWSQAKPSFDREACAGLNLTFLHTFTCSPKEMGIPGQEYFAGTHFNPNVTWWSKAGAFIAYLNRCHFMLQQGDFVADVVYYSGDHVPNIAQRKHADPAKVLPGYDYDVINEEILLRLDVEDGLLALPSGMRYNILALPDHKVLSLPALKRIQQLARDGATIVGVKPERTASLTGYPAADKEFDTLANLLWDGDVRAMNARDRLVEMGVPFDFEADKGGIDYIHRRTSSEDIYFVSNPSEEPVKVLCAFRVSAKQPELWNPVTGEIRNADAFSQEGSRTTVPLKFGPYASMFVVFRKAISPDATGAAQANFPKFTGRHRIRGDWQVSFAPRWGGPESITFDTLTSWIQRPEEGIKHYSGTAVYRKTFTLPSEISDADGIALDLGDVREIAQVTLNGTELGVLWTKPFRVDITAVVRPGENELEIEVVNNWPNRLIKDAGLPEAQRLTKTNVIKFKPDMPLYDSGLLGPVRVLARQNK